MGTFRNTFYKKGHVLLVVLFLLYGGSVYMQLRYINLILSRNKNTYIFTTTHIATHALKGIIISSTRYKALFNIVYLQYIIKHRPFYYAAAAAEKVYKTGILTNLIVLEFYVKMQPATSFQEYFIFSFFFWKG